MAISRTLFGSGFQMVLAAILLKTIRKPDFFVWFLNGRPSFYHSKAGPDIFPAKLDRFGMNKIFLLTLFFIKRSRLVLGLFFWLSNGRDWHKNEFENRTVSGFRMGTVL
jgi:hypothetical protein